jgi:hypothetical protein
MLCVYAVLLVIFSACGATTMSEEHEAGWATVDQARAIAHHQVIQGDPERPPSTRPIREQAIHQVTLREALEQVGMKPAPSDDPLRRVWIVHYTGHWEHGPDLPYIRAAVIIDVQTGRLEQTSWSALP